MQDGIEQTPRRRRWPAVAAIVLGTITLDAATKAAAVRALERYRSVEIAGEWLRFRLGYNEGVAFGLFATDGWGVIALSGLALVLLTVWAVRLIRDMTVPGWTTVALGLVLGGGIANLIDRIPDGRVTDFIDVGLGLHRWPTFNLADIFIVAGAGLILLGAFQRRPSDHEAG